MPLTHTYAHVYTHSLTLSTPTDTHDTLIHSRNYEFVLMPTESLDLSITPPKREELVQGIEGEGESIDSGYKAGEFILDEND